MKLVSKFLYSVKQGIKGIFSNKGMSFLSIASVSASLIMLGIVISVVTNINEFIKVTKDEINEIRVSIEEFNESQSELDTIKSEISSINGVNSIEYKQKEESFDEMKESWGEDSYLLDGVQNPLNDYYIVTIDNTDNIDKVAPELKSIPGVVDVEYHQDIMENFLNISNTVKKFGGIIIIFLLLICLVLISNTIKSRVYSKKEEIQIIKYVGGSNGFIIAPFVIEGFMIGLIGASLAVSTCILTYAYIHEKVNVLMMSIASNTILPLDQIAIYIIPILIIIGTGIGVIGSIISVKKYLKV